jgi:hypothetical protein
MRLGHTEDTVAVAVAAAGTTKFGCMARAGDLVSNGIAFHGYCEYQATASMLVAGQLAALHNSYVLVHTKGIGEGSD